MPPIHTVTQGETLSRIAQKYRFSSWKDIYHHPSNESFRQLRKNPDVIAPGDKIVIPEKEAWTGTLGTGKKHTFRISIEKQTLRLKLQDNSAAPWAGKRAVITVGEQKTELTLGSDGKIEVALLPDHPDQANLDVYIDAESDQPSHSYTLMLGYLDPVDTVAGVQARCNLLGFDCGKIDNIAGPLTRAGVKEFQEAYGLKVDGIAGPLTQAKLIEVYGC